MAWWNSIENLEACRSGLSWVIAVSGAVVGISGVLSLAVNNQLESLRAQEAAKHRQAETERSEKVLAAVTAVQATSAEPSRRADSLTRAAREAIGDRLVNLPANCIHVLLFEPTSESNEFGSVLIQLFAEKGRLAGSNTMKGVGIPLAADGRVIVKPRTNDSYVYAEYLAKGLIEAGIPKVVIDDSPPVLCTEETQVQVVLRPA